MSRLIETTSKVKVEGFSKEVELLANRLAEIHGGARLAREKNGIVIYIPSPYCLETYGPSELHKKHLAILAEWYLDPEHSNPNCGFCMKSGRRYDMDSLLSMPSVEARGYVGIPKEKKIVSKSDNTRYLVYDKNGNLIPAPPGKVIPIHECDGFNPGVQYLLSRGYDLESLWNQFNVSFCYEENPKMPYAYQPGGFKKTPQGRIIFYINQFGINRGWQGRILESIKDNLKYYWHPYNNHWIAVEEFKDNQWIPLPGFEEWNPGKYIIGLGTTRNDVLLGFDAALKFNEGLDIPKTIILTEGPLDAGKIGPPAVAIMGKWFSLGQAALVANNFSRIVVIRDNDRGGEEFLENVCRSLSTYGIAPVSITLPENVKDVGELTIKQAKNLVKDYLT